MTPYATTLRDVVAQLGTTSARRELITHLLEYRAALRAAGLVAECQWLAGSFVENIDHTRNPRDIDVVTFFYYKQSNQSVPACLVDREQVKDAYRLDSFFVGLDWPAIPMLGQVSYWLGLFSHQRETYRWKGIVQVPFQVDDADAWAALDDSGADDGEE